MRHLLLFTLLLGTSLCQAQAPDIEWQRIIGTNNNEGIDEIVVTSDGGYLVGSNNGNDASQDKTEDSRGALDYWMIKTDGTGNIQWDKTLGGSSSDVFREFLETDDGGFLLAGYSNSPISGDKTEDSEGFDYWIIKIDATGSVEWQNTIGGDLGDILSGASQASDGGYILGGTSNSPISGDKTEDPVGSDDYWVVKISATGVVEWDNTIGGTSIDILNCVRGTPDGGYIAAGSSFSGIGGDKTEANLGERDYWVVRLDSNGNVLWDRTIGGDETDRLIDVTITPAGDYILAGHSFSDMSAFKSEDSLGENDYWVVKLSADGTTVLWENTIGGDDNDYLDGVFPIASGGFMLAGNSSSAVSGDKTEPVRDANDMWAVKIDDNGNVVWDKTVGSQADNDEPTIIKPTLDGGFIMGAGGAHPIFGDKTIEGYDESFDGWMVKLEPETLGIDDLTEAGVSIYPNPATDLLHIDFRQSYQQAAVTIYAPTGQQILHKDLQSAQNTVLDLSLPSGMYLVEIQLDNDRRINKKLIIR